MEEQQYRKESQIQWLAKRKSSHETVERFSVDNESKHQNVATSNFFFLFYDP